MNLCRNVNKTLKCAYLLDMTEDSCLMSFKKIVFAFNLYLQLLFKILLLNHIRRKLLDLTN